MNILVYATAAEKSGALSILNQFYFKCTKSRKNYIFLVSIPKLESTKNVKVIRIPTIKKSKFYRLIFYFFIIQRIIKKEQIDSVISLNNLTIPRLKIPQTIYLHQPLPFTNYKPHLFFDPFLWYSKYILGFFIMLSLKKSEKIIVQSRWLKEILIYKYKVKSSVVIIEKPKLLKNEILGFNYSKPKNRLQYIFPADLYSYKNHIIIINALSKLNDETKEKMLIKFTIDKSQSNKARKLYIKKLKYNLPIEFIGYQSKKDMYKIYTTHTLLFPSKVETFGLPLIEAKNIGTPIICLDQEYSRETIDKYELVKYFQTYQELMEIFEEELEEI